MKIAVTFELNDENEMRGLTQFLSEVEAYRNPAKAIEAAAAQQPAPAVPADVTPAPTPVAATITPEGVVKPPKESELHEVTQAYMNAHGLDKALEVVRQVAGAVSRLSEVKDPAKLAEIYKRFSEGIKA